MGSTQGGHRAEEQSPPHQPQGAQVTSSTSSKGDTVHSAGELDPGEPVRSGAIFGCQMVVSPWRVLWVGTMWDGKAHSRLEAVQLPSGGEIF